MKLKAETPNQKTLIPSNAFVSLSFMSKQTGFALCRINNCQDLITCNKSSKTAIYNHVDNHGFGDELV